MGAVYIELGEPGKADGVARAGKGVSTGTGKEAMKVENLAGAVVFARQESEVYLAFVHDIFGHWTISKGSVKVDENIQQGAIREIKQEMGLDITIVEELGTNEYVANDSQVPGGKKIKKVTYYLAESPFVDIILGSSGGLDDAQWFPLSAVGDLNFYDDALTKIIIPAIKVLSRITQKN